MSGPNILDVVLLTPGPRGRTGLPAICVGQPGIAKTSIIERTAKRLGLPMETVILSLREPADVAGLPVIQADGGVNLEPPGWAKRLATAPEKGKDPQGVLFLDELSCSSPSVQAAALRVVAEGVVGDYVLPPGVRILAAANPEDQAAGGWGLAAPMANRMLHINWSPPSPEAWGDWLVNGDASSADDEVVVFDNAIWDQMWAVTRAQFAAFIRKRGADMLLKLPDNETERGRAWQSPRSWEMAARAVAGAKTLHAGEHVVLQLLYGAVGEGAGREAWAYFKGLDLPDPEKMLSGEEEVPLHRPDITFAALSATVAVGQLPHKEHDERIVLALERCSEVAVKHCDVAAACCKPIAGTNVLAPIWRHPRLSLRANKVFLGPLKGVVDILRAKGVAR